MGTSYSYTAYSGLSPVGQTSKLDRGKGRVKSSERDIQFVKKCGLKETTSS